jgi:hypothetical protein
VFPGKRRIDTLKKGYKSKNRKRDIAYSFTVGSNLKSLAGITLKYATLTKMKFGRGSSLSNFAKVVLLKR